jgi:hypothetical protein
MSSCYSGPMNTNNILVVGVICTVLVVQGCRCQENQYGNNLNLEVPVRSYPASTQFQVGDTLFWEGDFSKFVDVRGHQEPILPAVLTIGQAS